MSPAERSPPLPIEGAERASVAVAQKVGRYRRAVIVAADSGIARCQMEDDVHHFRVALHHDGISAQAVIGEAIRTPYSICPGAVEKTADLRGLTLETIARLPATSRFQQCMHMHDLAALAAEHALQDSARLHYRIEVDHDLTLPLACIWQDDRELLRWSIEGALIVGSRFDGTAFKDLESVLVGLDRDLAQAARLLRRASLISFVRRYDWSAVSPTEPIDARMPANCYAKRPERRASARLNTGTTRDFYREHRWPLQQTRNAVGHA